MKIADFELERYLARWEFDADHPLCASDPEEVDSHILSWVTS